MSSIATNPTFAGGRPPRPPRLAGPRASPLARKLAAAHGLDLRLIAGTGPRGRIQRVDVNRALDLGPRPTPTAPILPGNTGRPSPTAAQATATAGKNFMVPGPTVPVSAMRGTIARRLAEAKATIPHFYVEIEIDANPLIELRQRLNAVLEKSSLKLSFNDFILKASAEALRRVPAVNASWEADSSGRPHIRHHGSAHVAFAVALEDGLVTPVIQQAEQKSLTAISAESKLLVERAKSKRLLPEEYTCGTFCVSNLGMHGIKRFQAIINPPQSAILALGAITETPMVRNGSVVAGQQLVITMSCDHRVVDGALAAKYLNALKSLLENPLLLLLEGRELEFAGTVCREE